MDSLYESMPLEPNGDDIRFLRFKGNGRNKDEPGLRCSLVKASFKTTKYYTLSYLWGDPTPSERLVVNGLIVGITKNLSQALERFQAIVDEAAVSNDQLIWVDAICINQSNSTENSAQVQRMDEIYSYAETGIAWVGPSSETNDLAMEECKTTGRKLFFLSLGPLYENEELRTFTTNSERFDRLAAVLSDFFINHKEFLNTWTFIAVKSVWSLCQNPENLRLLVAEIKWLYSLDGSSTRNGWLDFISQDFWKRVWIYQEMALGKCVYLLCGSRSTRFEYYLVLGLVVMMGLRLGDVTGDAAASRDLFHTIGKSGMLQALMMTKVSSELPKLIDILTVCQNLGSTRAVDKIYGLLGVARDVRELGIQVDYSRTYAEICIDLTTRLIKQEGIYALCFGVNLPSPEVPSWVTFYSYLMGWDNKRYSFSTRDRSKFAASGKVSQAFDGRNFVHPGQLKILGITVDEIERAVPCDKRTHNPEIGFQRAKDTMNEIELLAATAAGKESFKNEETPPLWWLPVLLWAPSSAEEGVQHENLHRSYQAFRDAMALRSEQEGNCPLNRQESYLYWTKMRRSTCYRTFFVTSNTGFLGVGPYHAKEGDKIVIFHGGNMPFAIRPLESGRFRLLGEAYVLGIMDGELMVNNPPVEEFILE